MLMPSTTALARDGLLGLWQHDYQLIFSNKWSSWWLPRIPSNKNQTSLREIYWVVLNNVTEGGFHFIISKHEKNGLSYWTGRVMKTCHQHLTLAKWVAITSQAGSSISPWGSTSLTPLSGSSLWEAVIITPIAAPMWRQLVIFHW